MTRFAVLAFAVIGLAACSKKKDDSGGLPPASKWGSQQGGGAGAAGGGGGAGGGGAAADPTDPHAGLDMSGAGDVGDGTDPHAGLDMSGAGGTGGTDPHAGLDMSGAGGVGDGSNPHGGAGGMTGGRQPDPTHFLRGTLVLDPKLTGKLPANSVLFLAVKRPGTTGEPEGMPVMAQLIEQYDLTKPFAFDLNESNSMMGNVPELTGEVWILAYVDSDSNATTHLTGDLLGKVKVTVPQKDLKITIDTVLP